MKNRCRVQDFFEMLFARNEMKGNVLNNFLVEFIHRQGAPYPIFVYPPEAGKRLSTGTLQKPDRIQAQVIYGKIWGKPVFLGLNKRPTVESRTALRGKSK